MVPLWSLPTFAALLALCAVGLAGLRGVGRTRVLTDAAAVARSTLACVVCGVSFYAAASRSSDGAALRNAGALCFMALPAVSAIVLSLGAKRRAWGPGSVIGIVIGTGLAVVGVGVWVTLYLKGPRGGWVPLEILVCFVSVCVAFTASACLGWWCGRAMRRSHA